MQQASARARRATDHIRNRCEVRLAAANTLGPPGSRPRRASARTRRAMESHSVTPPSFDARNPTATTYGTVKYRSTMLTYCQQNARDSQTGDCFAFRSNAQRRQPRMESRPRKENSRHRSSKFPFRSRRECAFKPLSLCIESVPGKAAYRIKSVDFPVLASQREFSR